MSARHVVVVGGGVGGLTTAALLARGGTRVTLLERHERLGGRVGLWEQDGFRFDTGPSWYFMPEVFEHAFALLGARVEDHLDLVPLDPVYRLFPEPDTGVAQATPFDVVADAEANWRTFEQREPGAGEAMRAYVEQAGEAYRTALDRFLYTTFARPDRVLSTDVLRRSGTLARLLTQPLAEKIAGTVQDPVLRQALGYHAVFLGSSPYRVPALYSLMSHLDLHEGVRYPRHGMYTVVEALAALARREGVEIRTGVDVASIDVDAAPRTGRHPLRRGRVRGVTLGTGEHLAADVVVSAADRHHTETALLEPRFADLPAESWTHKGPGISALLVMAGVRGALPELAHHSLFFTRDWPANFDAILGPGRSTPPDGLHVPDVASLYVSRTTATDRTAAPPGTRTCSCWCRSPPTPAWATDPGQPGTPAGRGVRRPVPGPGGPVGGHQRPAGPGRGAQGRRTRRLRARPVGVAGHRPRHGAHAAAERLLPPGDVLAGRRGPAACRRGHGARRRAAHVPHRRRAGGQAAARRDVDPPLPAPLRPGYLAAALPSGLWSRT
ncbi:phytoene desaturase family protein [Cellulomonas soli]